MHVYPLPQITICDKKARKRANGPLKKIKKIKNTNKLNIHIF